MKTIIITGGAGFIGSNLAHHLAELGGYRLIVVDSFSAGTQWQNLVRVPADEIVAPSNLFYWLEMFGEEVEAIIHLGGISATTEQDVGLIIESNHQYPLLLWRWCAENDRRFIYASSAEIYGDGEHGFDDSLDTQDIRKLRPLNPNGWSKKLFDLYVAQAVARGEKTPKQWAGLRFFNVYGPNEYHKAHQRSVLLQLFEETNKGLPARLFKSGNPNYPDGGQMRDFTYVKDCVAALAWLLENPKVSGIFNCGTGKARSFNELANALFAALGRPPVIKYIDMPNQVVERQYQYYTQANLTRLREAGFTQEFTPLEQGVKDYYENYLTKADPYL
jgi:ADP-L-glycero-D-manno-heptose 6-epimerase